MATLVFVALGVLGLALAVVGLLSLRQPGSRLLRFAVLLLTLGVLSFLLRLASEWVGSA